jgi:hypothetical protein
LDHEVFSVQEFSCVIFYFILAHFINKAVNVVSEYIKISPMLFIKAGKRRKYFPLNFVWN